MMRTYCLNKNMSSSWGEIIANKLFSFTFSLTEIIFYVYNLEHVKLSNFNYKKCTEEWFECIPVQ